jgi:hypothetical protein
VQVGTITVDGRQVGVVTQGDDISDKFMPLLSDGGDGLGDSGRAGDSDIGTGKGFHHHGIGHSRPSHGEHEHRNRHHFPGHQHHPAPGRHHHPGHDQERTTRDDAGDIPYSRSGNPFADERIRKELEANPALREKIKHISLGENQDPRANLAVIETMRNRAIVRGTSLAAQAKRHRSSGVDEGGYYAGYAAHYSGEKGAMAERNIESMLRGSNISNYATDNSSGDLARREIATGAFRHHMTINGESFFSPGHAEPAFRDKWQQLNRQAGDHERGKTAQADKPFDPETMAP